MAAEIEIKFRVQDVAKLEARLAEIGAHLQTGRTFESNTLYDTPERTLRGRTEILRIREYGGRWTLTHKRLPDVVDPDARYKHRIETETSLADGNALAEVFTHLGFGPVFRYEKYRTEWELGGGHIVVDETPIGVWAELEGDPAWIDRLTRDLPVADELTTTLSYGALFAEWKDHTGSEAENLTFEEVRELAAR
jgi:adenylate cyclase class 2